MYFCFVFGLEPWLLPPAIEMTETLKAKGHKVKIIYAQYLGMQPDEKDYDAGDTYAIVPKQNGYKRLLTYRYLGRVVKNMLAKENCDFLIACDILSLHAISGISGVKKGYWGFEIVQKPVKIKMSLYLYRASIFPYWISKLNFFLAPSQSRIDKIKNRFRKQVPHEVIYNCRRFEQKKYKGGLTSTQNDSHKLVYTGRVSETQYVEEIIDAMELLDKNVQLYIAGPGNGAYTNKLKDKIKNSALLKDRVYLLGRLSREEVYALNETADIGFVFYNEQMGDEAKDPAPNKLCDYITAGVWSVGGEQPYIKYWLEERNAGVCINPVNKDTIAQGVRKIISDDKFKNKHVLYDLYHNELNMDTQADKLLTLIKKL